MRGVFVPALCVTLLVVGLFTLALYAQQPADQPLEATVVSVAGSVEVKLTPEGAWQSAEPGMKIPQGAQISTGVKSKVELDFEGHSVVTIRRPSIVRVDRFLVSERAVQTRLHLKVGTLRAGVVKERIASDFKITTPAVTLSARGTEIAEVTHSDRGTEVLMGKEGLLDMTKFFSPLGVTRVIPPQGYSRSSDLLRVVEAKKLTRTYRSQLYGRVGPEYDSASGDPSDLEDPKSELRREAAHPEFLRVLHQEALTSWLRDRNRNGRYWDQATD